MIKRCFSTLIIGLAFFFSFAELKAWTITHIQNDTSRAVRIEFSKIDDEEPPVPLDIAPGATVPFGQPCPFQPLGSTFDDFENLSTTLSIAPSSHPLCKGFIAEGVYRGLKIPATFYYQEGSPKPRAYIINPTLGVMNIRANSNRMYATLRLFEKDCVSIKKGARKRMFCELVDQKYLLASGNFSSNPNDKD